MKASAGAGRSRPTPKARRVGMLGVPVDTVSMEEALVLIESAIENRSGLHHGCISSALVVRLRSDRDLLDTFEGMDLITADGQGVVWGGRLLGLAIPERVTGIDLMVAVLDAAPARRRTIFLLGAKESTLSRSRRVIERDFPGAEVIGWHNGYFEACDERAVVCEIVRASPDVLFLAMPTPKKEDFIARYKLQLSKTVTISVGGSLDVLAGERWRAPRVMQRAGLEWLARVVQEPRRLGPKLVLGNARFAFLILTALIGSAGSRSRRQGVHHERRSRIVPVGRTSLTYVAITPVRDEVARIGRVFECLRAQTHPPQTWLIVNNGSTDGTAELCDRLARENRWIRHVTAAGSPVPERGGVVVEAFEEGLRSIRERPDVVVKVDADVSFGDEHFETILAAFHRAGDLGMASGVQLEYISGAWRPQHPVGLMVSAAVRAYRWECLEDVTPLERCVGWDGADNAKAWSKGWRTGVIAQTSFCHHRREGAREGRWTYWQREGRAAYFLGYRISYLMLKTCFRTSKELAAMGLLAGYAAAWGSKMEPRAEADIISQLRAAQRAREWPNRIREALRGRDDYASRHTRARP